MSPEELNDMIQRIKKLPDNLLIRVLKDLCWELDKRSEAYAQFLKAMMDQARYDTRNTIGD